MKLYFDFFDPVVMLRLGFTKYIFLDHDLSNWFVLANALYHSLIHLLIAELM